MTPRPALHKAPFALRFLRRLILMLPRGRHMIIRWVTPFVVNQPPFSASFDGNRQHFVADLSNRLARTIFFYGTYEQVQTAVFLHMLHPGQVVIDAGANVGYFSLLAAPRVGPTGRVVAFEPEPANASLLRRNIDLNDHTNVVVEEAAVGRAEGRLRLGRDAPGAGKGDTVSTVLEEAQDARYVIEVRAAALDGYCASHGIAQVDILKMDIEGGEADAVEGMQQGIQEGRYMRVLLEQHPMKLQRIARTPESVLHAFLKHGYSCWRMRNYPPGILGRYSCRFRSGLIERWKGERVEEHWPHFLLMANGVSLSYDEIR